METLDSETASPQVATFLPSSAETPAPPSGGSATFVRNSVISIGRILIKAAVALVLPAYLTHRLEVKSYSAWVLILQMGAYVSYLDIGIQTGIAKYVAEYEARKDFAGAGMRASAGLALMLCMSAIGVVLTLGLAWQVPHLFADMPVALVRDVRISLVFVGVSLSIGLAFSTCSAIFIGLQRYAISSGLLSINQLLLMVGVVAAVYFHTTLAVMGAVVAFVNVLTGVLQFVAWKRLALHIRLSLRRLDRPVVRDMVGYCASIAVWSAGMLCVTGLDVTIVGRYDFAQTAFYYTATLPTAFMLAITGAALSPLMPAASAMSVHRTPQQMGEMLFRTTRFASLLLIVSALPLLVAGYWILTLWVGADYATHSIGFLRILVLANIVRTTGAPYASMLLATNRQRVALGGVAGEAVINLVASVLLAQRFGAIGVAYGTLIGSFVSIGAHVAVNMRVTGEQFSVSRLRVLFSGILRPAVAAIPSLLVARLWWSSQAPAFSPRLWVVWGVCTALLAVFAGLDGDDRARVKTMLLGRLRKRDPAAA